MKTLVQRAFALVIATLALGLAHSANAQTIEFTSAPATLEVGQQGELWLRANLPTGVYENLTVELEFPSTTTHPWTTFVNATANADFTLTNSENNGVRTLRWTRAGSLDLSAGASTRQFLAVIQLRNDTFAGTPLLFKARVSGTKAGSAFGPVNAEYTVTATRKPPSFLIAGSVASAGSLVNPTVPVGDPARSGVRYLYQFTILNQHNDYQSAVTTAINLPKGVRFISASAVSTGVGDVLASVTNAPAAYAQNPSGASFQVTTTALGWSTGLTISVYVFIPCSELPTTTVAADYTASASSSFTTRDFSGALTNINGSHGSHRIASVPACGSNGGLTHSTNGVGSSGQTPIWFLGWTPGVGVTTLDEAIVVLRLPPETTSFTPTLNGWTGWSFFGCNFSALTFDSGNHQLTLAEFNQNKATLCRGSVAAGDTHAIYYANALSTVGVSSWGSYVSAQIPIDWRDRYGLTVNTHAYSLGTQGGIGPFGDTVLESSPSEDRWEASATNALPTTLVPTAAIFVSGQGTLDSNGGAAGSSYFTSRIGWTGFAPRNSRVTVEVPDGVTITSFSFNHGITGAQCDPPADKMVWPNLADRPLVFQFGTAANPYTQSGDCSVGAALHINFTVQPTYPFFHEQALPFSVTHTAENQTSQGLTQTPTFSAIVAAGQDSRLTVQCDPEGYPVFEARAVNRGRDPIDNGILRFVVPEGAAVMSIVPNAAVAGSNATLEVSFDDGQNWSTAGGSGPYTGVTDIRLDGIDIAGGSGAALRPQPGFFVTVDPGLASGTIEGEVTMWSAALGTTTPKFAAYEVGLCPGAVSVLVYFDANANEMWDDAEEAVGAGHHVKLTPTAGSLSGVETEAVTTDAQGWVYFLDVTPGEYDIVYVTGPATDGAWSTSVTEAVLVANDGEAWGTLGLSCVCEDPTLDTCSAAECNVAGACVEVFAEYDTPCDDGQTDAACNTDRCDGEGQCVPMPVETGTTCDNPESDNPCSVGGACDGQGACLPVAVEDGTQCGDSADCLDMLCSGGYCAESYVGYDEGSLCTDPAPDNSCLFGVCDGVGACRETFEEDGWECDDPNPDNPCDRGACFGGSCVAEPDNDGGTCDNPNGADPCTEGQCVDGTCAAVEANEGGLCADPTPLDPCTEGRCQVGVCDLADADDGTACTLEDACAATSECEAGQCVRTSEVACDDGDACTGDYCDDTLGGCAVTEPTCDRIAVAIPIADAVSGAARGHVLCFVTPSPSGGPGTLSCDTGSGTLVQHEGAGACGNTP